MSLQPREPNPSDTPSLYEWLPICKEPNDNWCDMVNDLYAEQNLRTSVYTDRVLRQTISSAGQPLTNQYNIVFFKDDEEDPDGRYLGGVFVNMAMGWSFNYLGNAGEQIAFAKLTDAFDKESGEVLTEGGQHHLLIPLRDINHLKLVR